MALYASRLVGIATSSDKGRIERAVRLSLYQDTDPTASHLAEDADDTRDSVRKHSSQSSTCSSPPPAKPNSPLI